MVKVSDNSSGPGPALLDVDAFDAPERIPDGCFRTTFDSAIQSWDTVPLTQVVIFAMGRLKEIWKGQKSFSILRETLKLARYQRW